LAYRIDTTVDFCVLRRNISVHMRLPTKIRREVNIIWQAATPQYKR